MELLIPIDAFAQRLGIADHGGAAVYPLRALG